jgi:hypothetical protein
MQDLWLAFISDPEKGLEAQGWSKYQPNGTAITFAEGGMVTGSIGVSELEVPCNGVNPVPGALRPL